MASRLPLALLSTILAGVAVIGAQQSPPRPPATDLDQLMERALARRDENWKKIDQYILDEREEVEIRGPGDTLAIGDKRDYAWFMRDGLFVRSPVKANGVTVSEDDRLAYEKRWLKQEESRQAARERELAEKKKGAAAPPTGTPPDQPVADDVNGLLQQTREPRFVSAGYFLEFDFEPGNYYLAGRETIDGRQLLRVEYYPTSLFDDRQNRRTQRRDQDTNPRQEEIRRQMNKTALVTLWVDQRSAEIVKYTFDNLGLDFIRSWLIRFDDMHATVEMVEPFAGVWLPGNVNIRLDFSLANGKYNVRYNLNYHDYKQAAAKATILPRR